MKLIIEVEFRQHVGNVESYWSITSWLKEKNVKKELYYQRLEDDSIRVIIIDTLRLQIFPNDWIMLLPKGDIIVLTDDEMKRFYLSQTVS